MMDTLDLVPAALLRTTILLSLAALLVGGLLRITRPHAPAIHRLAWACVLLQAVVLSPISLDIPWYEPVPVPQQAVPAMASPAVGSLPDFMHGSSGSSGDVRAPAAAPPNAAPAISHSTPLPRWRWQHWVIAGWAVGVFLVLTVTVASYLRLVRRLRRKQTPPDEWQQEWRRLLQREGVDRQIPLYGHSTLGPMLCRLPSGYCVVVPVRLWGRLPPSQRVAVLRHELAHYQRRDIWQSLVARLLALPHWFNPLAWWTVRKFDEVAEWSCDRRLAEARPQQVPDFARALLEMVESRCSRVGTTAAIGGSLSERFRRLLVFGIREDSVMKRMTIVTLLMGITLAGLLRVQLVARDRPEQIAVDEMDEQFVERVEQFADRIRIDGAHSELAGQLKRVLRTPAGLMVMRDRADHAAELRHEESHRSALPQFVDEYFVMDNGVLRLRDDREEFRQHFLEACRTFHEDVRSLEPAVQEIAADVSHDSDVGRLVARFLKHDAGPLMIYVTELRDRLHHTHEDVIADQLGELFVEDERGEFQIRPERRAEAQHYLSRGHELLEHLKHMHEELRAWSDDLAEADDLHRQLKVAFTDPLFASMMAAEAMDDDDHSAGRRIDDVFEDLEELTEDTGDGLVVSEQRRGDVEEALDHFRRVQDVAERLLEPVHEFAERIRPDDRLAEGWRDLLRTELALVKLAADDHPVEENPADAVHALLGEVLQRGDDGKYHVRGEDPEEVSEFIQEMFRMYRTVRRKGRHIDELAMQLDDSDLREAFRSVGGKFVIAQLIERHADTSTVDGLDAWIDEVFESTAAGLIIKEGAAEDIETVIEDYRLIRED